MSVHHFGSAHDSCEKAPVISLQMVVSSICGSREVNAGLQAAVSALKH